MPVKVLEDLMEGTLTLDYILNHARLGDPILGMLGHDKSEKIKNITTFLKWRIAFPLRLI